MWSSFTRFLYFVHGLFSGFVWYSENFEDNAITMPLDHHKVQFNAYINKFNKTYDTEEYLKIFQYFKESLGEIDRLNEGSKGAPLFGLTKFADMTMQEFEETMLLKPGAFGSACVDRHFECPHKYRSEPVSNKMDPPPQFDWRKEHVVGPVLWQKRCRACWAFSDVGVMESLIAIKSKKFHSHPTPFERLSIQEVIDLNPSHCDNGNAFASIETLCHHNVAITTEANYPLTLTDQNLQMCPDKGWIPTWIDTKCDVSAKDIKKEIFNRGPVVAVVNARPWKYYLDGVFRYHCEGTWDELKHVVQIVGYDTTAEVPYFIIRNSWGKDFGDNGYIKIAMDGFVCGLGRQIVTFDVHYTTEGRCN